jgi:isoleucyl-tRNA synthetase
VACHANQDSLAHISKNVLQASADELQKIRSVLRFALGALHDYQLREMEYKNLTLLDKYILYLLYAFHQQVISVWYYFFDENTWFEFLDARSNR